MSAMKKLMECISNLTEEKLGLLLEFVLQLLPTDEERPCCPHCGGAHVIKYGKKDGKQRFQCKKCKKTFMLTTNTIVAESHQPISVWRQFVADTLHLRPLDDSAQELKLSHQCAFDMRHKILFALQDLYQDNPTMLGEVTELDETYVLESYKGKALPDSIGREPRKHGSRLGMPIILLGLVFGGGGSTLVNIGIWVFSLAVLFQIITLPVEFNASSRALVMLEDYGILGQEEKRKAKSVLSAAAMTYVAAAAASILQLLRLIILFGGRSNDRD